MLYYTNISNAHAIIKQRNQAINFFIKGYFIKMRNMVEFLSYNEKIRNYPSANLNDRQDVLALYQTLEKADHDINYIYSGYKNGTLLINNYTPPANYNPVVRPWYQAAVKARPYISNGIPYREIKTNEWLVSISKVLVNDKNITTGVVSIDSSIKQVVDMLRERRKKYKSSYSFIAKPDGTVIVHFDKTFLNKTVSEIFHHPVSFNAKAGDSGHVLDFADKFIYYSFIDSIGWIVVTVIDKKEIMAPIFLQIMMNILTIGFIAVVFGKILSTLLGRRFIAPLVELQKRVKAVILGTHDSSSDYNYPENEIGAIAEDIELLTKNKLYEKNIELQNINKKLAILSITDQLTGLFNRYKMNHELKQEWKRAIRYNNKFSIIMLDIDFFKKINDTYGHQAGDAVLIEISQVIRNTLRSTDIISRWGGEEFLVLCLETNLNTAKNLADKLCRTIEKHQFSIGVTVTISGGISEFNNQKGIEKVIAEADRKLYKAKQEGRNQVLI